MPDLTPAYGLPYPNDADPLASALRDTPQALAFAIEAIVGALTGGTGPTWQNYTPTVSWESGAGLTTGHVSGSHLVIGRIVFWRVTIAINAAGTAAGQLRFGLPYPVADQHRIGEGRETTATGNGLQVFITSPTVAAVATMTNTTIIGANRLLQLNGWYRR